MFLKIQVKRSEASEVDQERPATMKSKKKQRKQFTGKSKRIKTFATNEENSSEISTMIRTRKARPRGGSRTREKWTEKKLFF
jgi:hypothetical protein